MSTNIRSIYPTDLSLFFRYSAEVITKKEETKSEKELFDYQVLLCKTHVLAQKLLSELKDLGEAKLVKKTQDLLPPAYPIPSSIAHLFCKAVCDRPYISEREIAEENILNPLSLEYPCTIEFGGYYYPSALHTYIAQMFPYSHEIKTEVGISPKENLAHIVLRHQDEINSRWADAKDEILRNVFHAKFGQNAQAKNALLSTLDAPISYQDSAIQSKLLVEEREYLGGSAARSFASREDNESVLYLDKCLSSIEEEIKAMNSGADKELYKLNTKIFQQEKARPLSRCPYENYPFDKTLVELSTHTPINANRVLEGKYIATQAPLAHAEEDFWRMIIESKSQAIVMLNETTDYLCYDYLPGDVKRPRKVGNATITLLEEKKTITSSEWFFSSEPEIFHGYTIKNIRVEIEGKRQILTHYQYHNWRDRGIGHEGCVLSLARRILSDPNVLDDPITVHCAAGVGRTATLLIILDQMIKQKQGQEINIPLCLQKLRSPEDGRFYKMVQSVQQYVFCYKTLSQSILSV